MGVSLARGSARHPAFPPVEKRVSSFLAGAPAVIRSAAAAIAVAAAVGACGEAAAGREPAVRPVAVDDAGRAVRVGAPARRVVSVVPSVTEVIVALGAGDRLVARTAYDRDPGLAHLPSVGATMYPGAEAVYAYRPELVVAPPARRAGGLAAQLEALGVPVFVADVQRTADIFSIISRIGRLLGVAARADSLAAALRAELEQVRREYASVHRRPAVLYLVWHDPPLIAGPGTFIDEVISAAGGRNAFADLAQRWPQVGLEEVVRRDPERIVVTRGAGHSIDPAVLRALPGWRELRAVREGGIVVVDADLFNRPGPRVVEAARRLGRALHGGSAGGPAASAEVWRAQAVRP